jgi:hypothetical protein
MKISIFIFITFLTFNALSQDIQNTGSVKEKSKPVVSFNVNFRPLFSSNYNFDYNNIIKRMPQKDVAPYLPSNNYWLNISNTASRNFNMEMVFSSRPNREFLIGVAYISGQKSKFDYYRYIVNRFDTINMQGYDLYADSFIYSDYTFKEDVEELGLIMEYLFKTDQSKNFSAFAGFGIHISYSFNNILSVTSIQDTSSHLTLDQNPRAFLLNFDPDKQYYLVSSGLEKKAKPSWFYRVYVPVGLNWNISKKDDFWKHINMSFLTQLGVEYRSISTGMDYKMYFGVFGLGLKYTF